MELEISNLRASLNSSSKDTDQISALKDSLARRDAELEKITKELADAKHNLTRAAEKAVKEGVDKTSTETKIKSLERELADIKTAKAEADSKIDTLEKKLEALGNLHRESENRNQSKIKDAEKFEAEAKSLKKRLVGVDNENARLREERERYQKREAGANGDGGDDAAIDDLEREERERLETRIRELEGENFELRSGVWRERRREMQVPIDGEDDAQGTFLGQPGGGDFDEVDLFGGRRASINPLTSPARPQMHSSFSTVLSSGIAAFTGGSGQQQGGQGAAGRARGASLGLLPDEDDDADFGFDEAAFALAQQEEEARKRVEWIREVKGKLRGWKGWRLDLRDSRAGVGFGAEGVRGAPGRGAQPVFGPVFDV